MISLRAPVRSNSHDHAPHLTDLINEAEARGAATGRLAGLEEAARHLLTIKVEAAQGDLTPEQNMTFLLQCVAEELRQLAHGVAIPRQRALRRHP